MAARSGPQIAPKLVGIAHTAVRPWDLRYFRPLEWFSSSDDSLPLPDKLLVTSRFCESRLREHWCNSLDIRLVETLRYPNKLEPRVTWQGLLVAMPYTAVEEAVMLNTVRLLERVLGTDLIKVQLHPLKRFSIKRKDTTLGAERPRLFLTDTTSTVLLDALEAGVPTLALHCGPLPNMSALADQESFKDVHEMISDDLTRKVEWSLLNVSPLQPLDYYARGRGLPLWRMFIDELSLGSQQD